MPIEVQSISAAGLAVLSAGGDHPKFDEQAIGNPQTGAVLTFVLERDGHSTTLQASLVWLELGGEQASGQRLELIVDTTDQPGWWEVRSALAQD